MKTLIIALNSKFIHSSLAVWYLKAACGSECGDVGVREFTINDSMDSVVASIYAEKPDIAAFSCYIWNIEYVARLVESLKKVLPELKIVLGGPEVSFDAGNILDNNPDVDYIIAGEGEESFRKLVRQLMSGNPINPEEINGLWYRRPDRVMTAGSCLFAGSLDSIPSPYTDEMLSTLDNKIVYYESSRGCPFSCSYCLSSTFNGVRYFSISRVKDDLSRLVKAGVKLVKFVDRTFNSNRVRAKEIFKFIIDNASGTSFHFEAAADLFDDEMLEILAKAPAGFIQFEIGVQTTNPVTLELINRRTNLKKVFDNVEKLSALGNIHLHLDLIAGLPGEDISSFRRSFDEVYSLRPHQLQMGFLKLLKGSAIREQAAGYGYRYRSYPPYEVLFNKYINFDEMLELKGIEDIVERYYNSGRFRASLEFIIARCFNSAYSFYLDFLMFSREKGLSGKAMSSRDTYTALHRFLKERADSQTLGAARDLMKLDFLSSDNSNNLPEGLEREIRPGFKEWCFEFLKDDTNIELYLPNFKDIPAKQIFKQVHFEVFSYDVNALCENMIVNEKKAVVLFDYTSRDKVTGIYKYVQLKYTDV